MIFLTLVLINFLNSMGKISIAFCLTLIFMHLNQTLLAQLPYNFVYSKSWTPSMHLSELKVGNILKLTTSNKEALFDLKFLATKKLEQLSNFRECISNPTIDGSPQKNILIDNYRWVEIYNWSFNKDELTLLNYNHSIVLKLVYLKTEKEKINSDINEMEFKVISINEK